MGNFVTHFVKHNVQPQVAAQVLLDIVFSGELIGNNTNIKGGFNCICFSDEPVGGSFGGLLGNYGTTPIYSPFGISVHKSTLFKLGGRPVIYQSDNEFYELPQSHQWRHVKYEPPRYDFTWEREWRIQRDRLSLREASAFIAVPSDYAQWFEDQFIVYREQNPQARLPNIWNFTLT